jgi:hypothetical protein
VTPPDHFIIIILRVFVFIIGVFTITVNGQSLCRMAYILTLGRLGADFCGYVMVLA